MKKQYFEFVNPSLPSTLWVNDPSRKINFKKDNLFVQVYYREEAPDIKFWTMGWNIYSSIEESCIDCPLLIGADDIIGSKVRVEIISGNEKIDLSRLNAKLIHSKQ